MFKNGDMGMKFFLLVLGLCTATAANAGENTVLTAGSRACENGTEYKPGDAIHESFQSFAFSPDMSSAQIDGNQYKLTLSGKNTYIAVPMVPVENGSAYFFVKMDAEGSVTVLGMDGSGDSCGGGLIVTLLAKK